MTIRLLRLIFIATLLWGGLIQAEEANPSTSSPSAAKTKSFSFSLAKIYGDDQPLMLEHTSSQALFSLPVPALWTPEKVTLNIKGIVSRGLIERSQIAILVNGKVIQQYPLQSNDHRLNLAVEIPVALLKVGYNQIKLMVSQHYTDICEYTEDPSLWTQINLVESNFEIEAKPSDMTATLNQLDGLFDKLSWIDQPTVKVMTAGKPSSSELTAMSLIAQGIGQRYDYAPVIIEHGTFPQQLAGFNATHNSQVSVLLGSHTALKLYLDDVSILKSNKPLIAVKTLPGETNHYLVILAGNTPEQLRELATVFALKGVPWPQLKSLALSEVQLPTTDNLQKRFSIPLSPTGAFPLRALEFRTTTYLDRDSNGTTVKIWNSSWQGRMQVRLHLSYVGGMSAQSALNILTNGIMHGTIPLNNPQGGSYENYAVTIPPGALKPGWNTIQFQPKLIPQSNGGKCQPFFNGNLGLTIYEDSTLQKFGGDELTKPDLALYSGKGSLFTEGPLGKGISFHVTDLSTETLSTGLTLVAKLTQMFERPLLNSTFTTATETNAKQQFWIGPYTKLPADIQDVFTGSLPDNIKIDVPLIQSATVQVNGGLNNYWSFLETLGFSQTSPPKFTGVNLKLSGALNHMAFIVSDLVDDNTVTVLTASDLKTLKQGTDTLIDYGHWSQLQGSFAYWDPNAEALHAVTFADAPFSAYDLRGGLGLWVSQNPWFALLLTLTFIGVMALVLRKALALYQQRKHRWTEEA